MVPLFVNTLLVTALAFIPADQLIHARYWDLGSVRAKGQLTLYNRDPGDAQNGLPVYGGDMNGDGFAEVIYTAFRADGPPGNLLPDAGEVHVWKSNGLIDGTRDVGSPHDSLWTFYGEKAGDILGIRVAVKDLDDDGYGDLIMGAFGADVPGRNLCGKAYVIFGAAELPTGEFWLADPAPWKTTIIGAEGDDRLGTWFDSADVNGDGFHDLVIGADRADGRNNGKPQSGDTYVLYGPIPRGVTLDLADTTLAWTVFYGIGQNDHMGATVISDDLDGDGYAEVITSAASNALARNVFDNGGSGDGPPGDFRDNSGETWVVWGRPDFQRYHDLDDPALGSTVVYGREPYGRYGEELSTGDVDGNGTKDLLIGALTAPGPPWEYRKDGGAGVIVYDMNLQRNRVVDLLYPPPDIRFTWVYGKARSLITDSFPVGDVDGDGFTDLLLGAPRDNGPLNREAGTLTVVYGSANLPAVIDLADPPPQNVVRTSTLDGKDANDLVAYWAHAADVNGDGRDDVIVNAMNGDGPRNSRWQAGEVYVVDGYTLSHGPDQPRNLSVVGVESSTELTLRLDPPDDPLVDRIRIYTSSESWIPGTDYEEFPSDVALCRMTGVEPGRLVYCSAAFVRADGTEGRRSPPVAGRLGTEPAPEWTLFHPTEYTVQMRWTPSANPLSLGYHVYRGAAGCDPEDLVRITSAPLFVPEFTDPGPPRNTLIEYRITGIDSLLWESSWSSPRTAFLHDREPYPFRILVVNGFDWNAWSDGAGTAAPADPWEMYRDKALTADLPFDFWDLRIGWSNYPSGITPVGKGPLPPARLFEYSGIIWVGNDDASNVNPDRDVFQNLLPDLTRYLDDGGKLILVSRLLGSYVSEQFARDVCGVAAWDRYETFTTATPAQPVWSGLVPMTPRPGSTGVPFCEPMVFDGTGLGTPILTYGTAGSVIGALVRHPVRNTDRVALLSLSPNYTNPYELRANMRRLINHLTGLSTVTGTEEAGRPPVTRLLQSAPNPMTTEATIAFELAREQRVSLRVYDASGRLVRTLLDASFPAGRNGADWDGLADGGRPAASGVYFYRLETADGDLTRKLTLRR